VSQTPNFNSPQSSGSFASDKLLSPSQKLQLSRLRLQNALRDAHAPADDTQRPSTDPGAQAWLSSLKQVPGAALVLELAAQWWAKHPLNLASKLASDAANAAVKPMAERHPFALVAGAAIVGGIVGWSRPWRWIMKSAVVAGLLPSLLPRVLPSILPTLLGKTASAEPSVSWLSVLTSLVLNPQKPSAKADKNP
jgi:hypothetical protein